MSRMSNGLSCSRFFFFFRSKSTNIYKWMKSGQEVEEEEEVKKGHLVN